MSALLEGAKAARSAGARPGRGSTPRPLIVTGAVAAACAAASGLALLITLVLIGWIAAPHAAFGTGLPGVFRTASQLWLVAHHVGFSLHGASQSASQSASQTASHGASQVAGRGAASTGTGRIGMLPLGLVVLPGALLYRAGRWVVRSGDVARLRHVGYGALALAAPYALLAAALAMIGRTQLATPSLWEAMVAAFLLAFAAGAIGGARALAPWNSLLRLLPERPRSLVAGTLGTLAVLTAAGAALAAGSLAAHIGTFRSLTSALAPGVVGGVLLLLIELAFVPNAVIWAIAYVLGPGFAFGYGTVVAPTGTALGGLPMFPMLAALPSGGVAGQPAVAPAWVSLGTLATPYLAGMFGGLLIVRVGPTPRIEAAPLWGFACGAATGVVTGVLAAFAGGPLGGVRLTAIGPSGWQVWLVTTLEVGVAAAATAGVVNWFAVGRGGIEDLPPAVSPPAAEPAHEIAATPGDDGHHIYMDPWAAEADGPEHSASPAGRPPAVPAGGHPRTPDSPGGGPPTATP